MLLWYALIMCKPWILQRLDLYIYVDIILLVMCKENHTISNVHINLTQTMLGSCFPSCLLEGTCLIYINCARLCIMVSNIHCVLFLLCFILSVSLDCYFWIVLWYSLTFSYRRLTFLQIVFGPSRFLPNIITLPVLFDIPA